MDDTLRKLPIKERMDLVEDLWDSIAADQDALPLTAAQRALLDERLARFDRPESERANLDSGLALSTDGARSPSGGCAKGYARPDAQSNTNRTFCYVDGFNLYHAIRELHSPHLKWLDLWALAQSFLTQNDELMNVVYFTAVADWNPEKARRHRAYIAALRARGVEVVQSRFQKAVKVCSTWNRSCAFHEEKETDVAFATRALADALNGGADKQVMITADTDHVPLLKLLRTIRPHLHLLLAAPPGRLRRANALRIHAGRTIEIQPQRLGACLLPRNVRDCEGRKVAVCPADYLR